MSEDDPALDNDLALRLDWYHTSTHDRWPSTIDFAAGLNDDLRRMMGGDEAVLQWARGQSAKALHVGTYEAAIHNMLRRIADQGDEGKQFYLYRVQLNPEAVMWPEWVPDSSNFVGDWHLDELFSSEVKVVRYVNYHEDAGGLSLAIRPSALLATQRLAIPLPTANDDPWTVDTVDRLQAEPPDHSLPVGLERHRHLLQDSPRAVVAAAASSVLANRLPVNLRDQFGASTRWHPESEPSDWAHYAMGLASLVEDWARVLAELDDRPANEH